MTRETIIAASGLTVIAAIIGYRFWCHQSMNAPQPSNLVAPDPSMSNSPAIDPSAEFGTPYYLQYNVPISRGGSGVLPPIAMTPGQYDYEPPAMNAPQL